ncbi:hypothetical protein P153DRAFT_398203 [Dothidotthia symphoricarpi CBS 119687]|uniref:Uncharacterized protein n=1 Tax=Dothidotthia symphoricarpi CBS 119687 TaxID=1392245 RepID=A0A6A6A9S7_9PLEO|nr:uncharacterized protein P153DRAFT_398203 [Dothidotthia symphoricarpi CBS 119687]KAF2127597.1 hypothetical protein P153DRAFT_398203 [Dothidotthia symphoricarpi CBS 119687]
MGRWQPYLYEPQRDMDDFNPRAATMASRIPPPEPKKQEGPLINFNRHPDSYLIMPYGKTDIQPMNPKTKLFVDIARWIQFSLRICTLLGAIGIFVCSIFIKGMRETEGYILRISPAVDIVICLYAIYHLVRNAKSRPPGSAASYHFFALVLDVGFLPFYVFTVLISWRNYNMNVGTVGRWRTMFPTNDDANKVLLTTWITAIAVGGIHLISTFVDMYLIVIFRKISNMPPDMNPLEDNLTSRRKSKHKYKNSSVSTITLTGEDEKRFSAQSTIAGDRNSQADPLLSKDVPSPTKTQIAFLNTRTNSEATYSPHTPNSARQSRERFSMYSQPQSIHHSQSVIDHRDDLHSQREDDDNQTLAQRQSFLAEQANIKRHSRTDSFVPPLTSPVRQNFSRPVVSPRSDKHNTSGDLSLQNNIQENLHTDNWVVHAEQDDDAEHGSQYLAPKHSMFPSRKGYNTVSTYEDVSDREDGLEQTMVPQPLRMNPPTPPPPTSPYEEARSSRSPASGLKRTHTTTSISTEATFNRSYSQSRSGTPKSRYYGDLKAATDGVRSGHSPANTPGSSPTKRSYKNEQNNLPSATKQYMANSSNAPKDFVNNSPFTLEKKSYTSVRRTGDAGYTATKGQSPRVVSRSGVDYMNPYEFDDSDLGMPGRRRDVSGKVAEEGRGGAWAGRSDHGLTYRKASGVI